MDQPPPQPGPQRPEGEAGQHGSRGAGGAAGLGDSILFLASFQILRSIKDFISRFRPLLSCRQVSASQGRPGYVKQVQQMLATHDTAAGAAPPSAARGPRSGSGGHAAPSRARASDAGAATGPAPSKTEHSMESERLLKEELAKVREEMARMTAHMTAITQFGAKAMAQLPHLVQQQVRAASRGKSRGRSRNNSR